MIKEEAKINFTKTIADQITKDTKNPDDVQKLLTSNQGVADSYFKDYDNFEKTFDDPKKTKITITATKDPNNTSKINYAVDIKETIK